MSDYYDLGRYSRPVTTKSPQAQVLFDRGLLWYYGFNREESVRCFRRAADHDPECAIAWWGIASASGSEYNKRWEESQVAVQHRKLADKPSVERMKEYWAVRASRLSAA